MRHAYWISAAMGGRLRCRSRGLTLLELIVVLVILAALGTVMITQTTSLTGEARYQQTVRTLEQLQDAVIGRQPVGGEDPTGIGPGFVSDMGRLPEAVADGTAFTLAELWDRNLFTDADLFAVRNLTGLDNDLQLASGWRGPYVRLPVGASTLRDGWGGEYDLEDDAGVDVDAAGDPIGSVGSDGSGVGDAFDPAVPLEVVFADSSATPVIDQWNGSVPASMSIEFSLPATPTQTEYGLVRLYGIRDGEPVVLFQSDVFSYPPPMDGTRKTILVTFTDPDPGTPGLSMVIGPKVLRAYQLESSEAPPNAAPLPTDDLTTLAGGSARAKSDPVRFTLPTGGLNALPLLILEGQ